MMSMLENLKGPDCRRNAWIVGAVAGFVLLILALLFGASFLLGLILGVILAVGVALYLQSRICAEDARPAAPAQPVAAPEPEAMPEAKPAAAPTPAPAPAPVGPTKPTTLAAPREDGADDLKKIKGVGPKLEALLNSMGFYHFDQIAGWTGAEVDWVDENLEGFKGRVTRDNWVEQARTLASGGKTEFSSRVDKGGVY